jgi:hypothetical protein
MNCISRRDLIAAALGVLGAPALCAGDEPAKAPAPYADSAAVDAWVQEWAVSKRGLLGALNLFRFADPMYAITKEITWTPNMAQASNFQAVTVPARFVTDLASIPRIFWSALRPDGDYAYAAIIHDYLYWTQTVRRETADEVLRLAMQDLAVAPATVTVIYKAVRLGGSGAWQENARLKTSGEKRVLKRLPDDPTMRWADWKRNPDVFP